MVILHVFLVCSWEASGKHTGDPKGDLQVICAVQTGEVVQIPCNSGTDFLGSAHLGLKMCPNVVQQPPLDASCSVCLT